MRESFASLAVTMKLYGWSKWGGARNSISTLLVDEDWYCQVCGEQETKDLPAYFVPYDDTQRDFIKVCSVCRNKSLKKKLTLAFALIAELKTAF